VVTTAGRLTSTISRPPLTSHVTVALKVKDTSELATQHRIALHDVVVAETKKTAALLTIGQFPVQGAAGFNEEFISRVGRYETAVADVMKLQALLGYWAGTANEAALTLAPKRLADEICPETGLVVWTQTLYARALGNARGGNPAAAEPDVQELAKVVAALKDNYWMTETEVQRLTTQGWVEFAKGNRGAARFRSTRVPPSCDVNVNVWNSGPLLSVAVNAIRLDGVSAVTWSSDRLRLPWSVPSAL